MPSYAKRNHNKWSLTIINSDHHEPLPTTGDLLGTKCPIWVPQTSIIWFGDTKPKQKNSSKKSLWSCQGSHMLRFLEYQRIPISLYRWLSLTRELGMLIQQGQSFRCTFQHLWWATHIHIILESVRFWSRNRVCENRNKYAENCDLFVGMFNDHLVMQIAFKAASLIHV